VIKEIASIKLDTECVKMQINYEIERIQTEKSRNNDQIECEVIEENPTQTEKEVVEEKSSAAQTQTNVEIIDKIPAESLPPTDYSSSLFGFQLLSPQKSVQTTPISTNIGFSFGEDLQEKNTPTDSKANPFSSDSFFGNSSPKTHSLNDPVVSNIDPIFGNFGQNFGQNSPKNDSPFNFNFGNTSNESNGSNSPLMWK